MSLRTRMHTRTALVISLFLLAPCPLNASPQISKRLRKEGFKTITKPQLVKTFDDRLRSLAFDPTGKMLAAAVGSMVEILQWPGGKHLRELVSPARAVSFSRDGKYLGALSGYRGRDRTLTLIRVGSWETAWKKRIEADSQRMSEVDILTLSFSADSKTLAIGGAEVTLFDVETGALMKVIGGHEGGVNAVAYSPDGRYLATAGKDRTLRLWSPQGDRLQRTIKGLDYEVLAVAFSADGKYMACGTGDYDAGGGTRVGDGTVHLWKVGSGVLMWKQKHPDVVQSLAFSHDGNNLASGGWWQTRVWDVRSGKLRWELSETEGTEFPTAVYATAFSPTERLLVTGGECDGSGCGVIRFWDIALLRK